MTLILVTGGAGFIGSHVCEALLRRGDSVRILDSFDPFYDERQKRANLARLDALHGDLELLEGDIRDASACQQATQGANGVIHLAALAGVRPSIERPADYWDVNLVGTQRLFDALRDRKECRIVFGSSSSVYGGNTKVPFHEEDPVLHPVSPYAASKRAGELLCHAFHHLHGHSIACLRFFTVFGPGQRPEMAIHKFTRKIVDGDPLPFFGDGSTARDYTFVDDIVSGVVAALDRNEGYRIYNLGGDDTTTLAELVEILEAAIGKEAILDRLPDQAGDVRLTNADVSRARQELGYRPTTSVKDGVGRFVDWYHAARAAKEIL